MHAKKSSLSSLCIGEDEVVDKIDNLWINRVVCLIEKTEIAWFGKRNKVPKYKN